MWAMWLAQVTYHNGNRIDILNEIIGRAIQLHCGGHRTNVATINLQITWYSVSA